MALASERSLALTKCESQLAESQARNAALDRILEERSSPRSAGANPSAEPTKDSDEQPAGAGNEALQSTIKSLQRIVTQREETIARYQGLLKEDRDKHSEAAARLHEEIKCLRAQLARSPRTDNAMLAAFLLPRSGSFPLHRASRRGDETPELYTLPRPLRREGIRGGRVGERCRHEFTAPIFKADLASRLGFMNPTSRDACSVISRNSDKLEGVIGAAQFNLSLVYRILLNISQLRKFNLGAFINR